MRDKRRTNFLWLFPHLPEEKEVKQKSTLSDVVCRISSFIPRGRRPLKSRTKKRQKQEEDLCQREPLSNTAFCFPSIQLRPGGEGRKEKRYRLHTRSHRRQEGEPLLSACVIISNTTRGSTCLAGFLVARTEGRKSLPLLSVGILRAVSPYYYSTTLLLFGDTASSSPLTSPVVYSTKHASSSSYFPFCLRQNLTSCLDLAFSNAKPQEFSLPMLGALSGKVSPYGHKFEFLCLARLFPTSSERGRLQLGLEVPLGANLLYL